MADLESTLSGILSDPDAMQKIQELGKSLGLTGNNQQASPEPAPEPKQKAGGADLSALSSLLSATANQNTSPLSGLADSETLSKLTKFLPILSSMNKEDETTALLHALRPFLSEQRRKRLDEAGKMLRIMRILPFIRNSGLL